MNATMLEPAPVPPTAGDTNRFTVLFGHTSFETAAVVENYPYGSLRTRMKYWVETATKGAKKGESRLVTCSLNPKTGRWNKPHGGVYSDWAWLYRDERDGHLHHWGVGRHDVVGGVAKIKAVGIWDQLPAEERAKFDAVVERVRSRSAGDGYHATWFATVERVRSAAREHGYDNPDLYALGGFDSSGSVGWIYVSDFLTALAMVKAEDTGEWTLPDPH